jgi:hypothetical protein
MIEFIEHPSDSLIIGKLPIVIQCEVINADRLTFECGGNKVREDAKRNSSIEIGGVRHDKLTLMLKRKDLENKNSFNSFGISKKLICKCVAYSNRTNERLVSNKAIIRNSCIILLYFFYLKLT